VKCLSCHCEKDQNNLEIYPYSEETDGITQEIAIEPLLSIECIQSPRYEDRKPKFKTCDIRTAIMCHDCWHQLCKNTQGIDMWISDACWRTLNPKTAFEDLPKGTND